MKQGIFVFIAACIAVSLAAPPLHPVEEVEVEEPPQPYSFSYAAGRKPGHVDRVHSETRDALGVVRGEFSYVDPRNKVRTVQYVADAAGFHPVLNSGAHAVTDTPVVAAAKLRHLALKDRIAAEHARIGAEHARLNAERAALLPPLEQVPEPAPIVTQTRAEIVEEPPRPYSFSYEAGRAPGHIDRTHSESRGESGIVRGEFSYLDPRYQVRTVQYVADSEGFHAVVNAPPTDTPAVAAARQRHLALHERIAAQHALIAQQHEERRAAQQTNTIL